MNDIERVTADDAQSLLSQLIALLQDSVDDGASVGFLRPLAADVAEGYWREVIGDVAAQSSILLVTRREGLVVGSVQLRLCTKPNGVHRAEVQKLLVHTRWRRQGIGHALMAAVEREARLAGRSLLYLDTEPDRPALTLYERTGWLRAGEIPDYARTPDGQLHSTVLLYRRI